MAALVCCLYAPSPLLPVDGVIRRSFSAPAAAPLRLNAVAPVIRRQRCCGGGRWALQPVVAFSTSFPIEGRAGRQRREGSVSFFSFGVSSDGFLVGKDRAEAVSQALSAILPFVVVATAVSALANPSAFSWVSKKYYAPALGGIMLSVGFKLSIDDFALAFQTPLPLYVGYVAQYVIKPLLGLLIARAFRIPSMFYAGFILTSCVSGAQLSSYASFLSKGDVALSILLTSISTISSAFVTPVLTGLLIGSVVPVDAVAMSKSILQARTCEQNTITVYRNAKFDARWPPCDPVPWYHSSSPCSLLRCGDGHCWLKPCILLGQRIANQRYPIAHFPTNLLQYRLLRHTRTS